MTSTISDQRIGSNIAMGSTISPAQWDLLKQVLSAARRGNTTPLSDLVVEIRSRRQASAQSEWRGYRLWCHLTDCHVARGVITPEWHMYQRIAVTTVRPAYFRFPDCLDQQFIDEINTAIEQFIPKTRPLMTKHEGIMRLLQIALNDSECEWTPVLCTIDGEEVVTGYETTPISTIDIAQNVIASINARSHGEGDYDAARDRADRGEYVKGGGYNDR